MRYKAIFTDMDGTLLNSQHKISPRTAKAIQQVIAKGIPFIPVSARPPYAITPYLAHLNIQQSIICYSGALILDESLDERYSVFIAANELAELTKTLNHYQHLSINYYVGLDWFSNNLDNYWTRQESNITGLQAKFIPLQLDYAHKVLIMGDASEIQPLAQKLQEQFPHLSIHLSKPEYLEIMHKKATKAQAIAFIAQHLQVNAPEIIAFGDNFNDVDMLQYAGLSIAMDNAPDAVKQIAKEVTASNDNDGIAQILEREFSLH